MTTQTLASGPTIASRYGKFGAAGQRSLQHPAFLFGMIVGLPGSGKTSLFHDHAGALHLNLDLTSTPRNTQQDKPPAYQTFPLIDEDGTIRDTSGSRIYLSYEHIVDLQSRLIQASANGDPRPQTIIVDTLTSMLDLLVSYVPRHAKELNIASANKQSFDELHGPAAYDAMYGLVVSFCSSLKQAGYGVYLVSHLNNQLIQLGEDRHKLVYAHSITANFNKRLHPRTDLVLASLKQITTANEMQTKEVKVGGKTTTLTKPMAVTRTRFNLTCNAEELAGITKCKVPLEDPWEIPAINPWAAFVRAYMDAGLGKAPTPTPLLPEE